MKQIQTSATIKRILQEHFGIQLTRGDLVHHIDHNRGNNEIHKRKKG